jgi:hypothetical protein
MQQPPPLQSPRATAAFDLHSHRCCRTPRAAAASFAPRRRGGVFAVAIFSRHYCVSDYCLRELTTLDEARKTIIPVFYDVQPDDLVLP